MYSAAAFDKGALHFIPFRLYHFFRSLIASNHKKQELHLVYCLYLWLQLMPWGFLLSITVVSFRFPLQQPQMVEQGRRVMLNAGATGSMGQTTSNALKAWRTSYSVSYGDRVQGERETLLHINTVKCFIFIHFYYTYYKYFSGAVCRRHT